MILLASVQSPFAESFGIDPWWFHWVIVPALIFMARIIDVSINTIRVLFVMSGRKGLAPIMGFFESLIWLIAISQIMSNVGNVVSYLAYAGGFATGVYLGMTIEEKLAYGNVIIRLIATDDLIDLETIIKDAGYRLTIVDARGARGAVKLIFTVMKRTEAKGFLAMLNEKHPNAFYTLENVRYVTDFDDNLSDLDEGAPMQRFIRSLKRK